MNKYIIFLGLLLLAGKVLAQPGLEFSGYVVNLPIYTVTEGFGDKNEGDFSNLTRLRLRPTVNFNYSSRINIEYEVTSYYFDSPSAFNNTNYDKSNRQLVDLTWQPINKSDYSLVHTIDRLSYRHEFDWGSIEAGRQRVAWGSGRVWNPTDLFNPINPASFSKIEKEGADAVTLVYYFGSFTDLTLVYNPQEVIGNSNYGYRFRTNVGEYDLITVGGYFDERYVTGFDFAGNLLKAGIRGEGIISFDEDDFSENYVKFILGADYQFTPELYGLIEYHYNGEGKTNKNRYELLRLIDGEIINLGRHYINVTSNYKLHPLVTLNFSNNTNLLDASGYVSFVTDYSYTEDIYIKAGMQINYGSRRSEYWYYPDSYYLQGEFYF